MNLGCGCFFAKHGRSGKSVAACRNAVKRSIHQSHLLSTPNTVYVAGGA
jgi:hypothetical protein